jgi:hypothetical protein
MSDFLFARPSFLEGVARNLDLFGVLNVYNYSENGEKADAKALLSDWAAIYRDLNNSYDGLKCQIESRKNAN